MGKLTTLKIKTMKTPGRFGDGDGLWLQVRSPENRSWLFRYVSPVTKKARVLGLGPEKLVSLAEAREAARDAARQVFKGIDPLDLRAEQATAQKAEALAGTTFRQAAEAYLKANSAKWGNEKHAAQWSATLTTYAFPIVGDKPVQAIETSHVVKILEPIWHSKTETASRLRGRVETVLAYATTHGMREGENPARWRGHLEHVLPKRSEVAKVEHHAALPWREMPEFIRTTLAGEDGVTGMALNFLIHTAARTGEVLGATWAEVDLAAKVWTIPGLRMKAKKEHRVPLSPATVVLLQKASELGQHRDTPIFPGRKDGQPLSNMALLKLLRRVGRGDLTSHGFRSSFRDWASEATSYHPHVAEMALAHTIGDKVEAAYRRGDLMEKRAAMMAEWSAFLTGSAQS